MRQILVVGNIFFVKVEQFVIVMMRNSYGLAYVEKYFSFLKSANNTCLVSGRLYSTQNHVSTLEICIFTLSCV